MHGGSLNIDITTDRLVAVKEWQAGYLLTFKGLFWPSCSVSDVAAAVASSVAFGAMFKRGYAKTYFWRRQWGGRSKKTPARKDLSWDGKSLT